MAYYSVPGRTAARQRSYLNMAPSELAEKGKKMKRVIAIMSDKALLLVGASSQAEQVQM